LRTTPFVSLCSLIICVQLMFFVFFVKSYKILTPPPPSKQPLEPCLLLHHKHCTSLRRTLATNLEPLLPLPLPWRQWNYPMPGNVAIFVPSSKKHVHSVISSAPQTKERALTNVGISPLPRNSSPHTTSNGLGRQASNQRRLTSPSTPLHAHPLVDGGRE
jgi:hypothetical protein